MLRAMGNLAERYKDAARSGVYGVRDGAIPRTAALEAEALLIEVPAVRLGPEWTRVEQALEARDGRACVLLVPGGAALAPVEHRAVLERLGVAARDARETGRPLFAVLVDPGGVLGLPPLYREKPPG